MSDTDDNISTVTVPGLGDVPSPTDCAEQKDGRKQTISINTACPVCGKGPYKTFASLRGHFGNESGDSAHQAYDLTVESVR